MAGGFVLSAHAVAQLKKNYDALRLEVQHINARIATDKARPFGTELREDAVIFKAAEEITARRGTTLGSGPANRQDQEPGATATGDSGRGENVYNVNDTAIASGDYFKAVRDFKTGDWLAQAAGGGGSTTVIDADICYVVAQSYWTYSGGNYPSTTSTIIASVQVKKCDSDGTATGSTFTCWLPVCNTGCDPNVVTGQIFTAGKFINPSDSSESWAAISGHEDAAIGTVRMLTGNFPANDATGWAEMDGNQDPGESAAGVAIDMDGAVPKHAAAVNTDNGGVDTPSGSTSIDSDGGHTVSITTTSVTTDSSETGITSTDAMDAGTVEATTTEVEEADMMPTTVVDSITGGDDLEHTHNIADPGHPHTLTGTFSGTMAAYWHNHTHQIQKSITLRFFERIDNSS